MFALFRAVGEAWVGLAEVEHRRAKLFPCSSSVSSIGGPLDVQGSRARVGAIDFVEFDRLAPLDN